VPASRELVPATPALVKKYYGSLSEKSVRAIAVVDGDKVLGIGGVYLDDARQVVFAEITDELRSRPRLLLLAWRKLRAIIEKRKLPTHSLADEKVEASGRFLSHLGFSHIERGVYEWQP